MSRKTFRIILVALLVITGAIAAWSWLRPYEWGADKSAGCRIVGCQVKEDHSNYWINLHLKVAEDASIDLQTPVQLLTADGTSIMPADTTLAGDKEKAVRDIWLKFWVHQKDLKGELKLQINGAKLSVRQGSGVPKLRSTGSRYFVTDNW
ncbi:MAG: hypothetical protein R3242_07180 [Akkermansiaceae bacterium]|nr:hypothetical protein [Akkermansiaceae bacterium]